MMKRVIVALRCQNLTKNSGPLFFKRHPAPPYLFGVSHHSAYIIHSHAPAASDDPTVHPTPPTATRIIMRVFACIYAKNTIRDTDGFLLFYSFSTRAARTALASTALLVLSTVAAPAANAYNPNIDGDGKKTVLTAPNDLKTLKLQAKGKEVQQGAYSSEAELSGEIEKNEMTADRARAEGLVPAKD